MCERLCVRDCVFEIVYAKLFVIGCVCVIGSVNVCVIAFVVWLCVLGFM